MDCETNLSPKEVKYLNENEQITALVLTEMYGTVVSVLVGIPEKAEISMITNEGKIEEIDWKKVYKRTNTIHEKMKKWAAKETK